MDWFVAILSTVVFVGFALREALRDKTPRGPQWEWWRRKPELIWWAHRRTVGERKRNRIDLGQ